MDDVKLLVDGIKKRIENKYDFVAGITGEEGTGKSTFAIQLGMNFGDFDLENNVVYLPKTQEVRDKFRKTPDKGILVIDEAIKALYKQNWREKIQTEINQLYATERWRNKVTLLLMPRFTDFNEFFRNHRIKFWFHILRRGLGVFLIKDDLNPFAPDPWYMKENFKIIYEHTKRFKNIYKVDVDSLLKIFENKIPNFVSSFTWEPLPEKVEQKYIELKAKSREIAETEEAANVDKTLIIKKLYEKGFTQKQIAEIAGLTQPTVSYLLKKYGY